MLLACNPASCVVPITLVQFLVAYINSNIFRPILNLKLQAYITLYTEFYFIHFKLHIKANLVFFHMK